MQYLIEQGLGGRGGSRPPLGLFSRGLNDGDGRAPRNEQEREDRGASHPSSGRKLPPTRHCAPIARPATTPPGRECPANCDFGMFFCGDAETRSGRLWACRAAAPSEHADSRRSWKANKAIHRREFVPRSWSAWRIRLTPGFACMRLARSLIGNQDNLRCAPARGDGPSARRVAAPGQ